MTGRASGGGCDNRIVGAEGIIDSPLISCLHKTAGVPR